MKTILLIILLQAVYPQYEFKSTSGYLNHTQTTSNIQDNNSYQTRPKKVSGTGWIDYYVWGYWNGVPSSASNEEMYAYYQYIQNGGTLSYNDWWNQNYNVPLGNPIIPLLMFIFPYILYKSKKLKRSYNLPYINKVN